MGPSTSQQSPAVTTVSTHSASPLFRQGLRPVRIAGFSGTVDGRTLLITAALLAAAAGVAWWNMISGSAHISAGETLTALFGAADEDTSRVVLEWRAPRVAFTLLGGAALAVAGAVFQSQTRNPLGSPDIIGFSTGAYTGALLVASMGLTGVWSTPLGAVAGGLGTGLLVYLLAWKRGVSGLRIILVGIGVSMFLSSVNTYLLTTLDLEIAMSVAIWGAGSVNDIAWAHVLPLVMIMVLTLPVMLTLAREMRLMEMGDDAAAGLGIRLERVRLIQFSGGILLVAVVTAAAGPIAFVALVAPQLALRLTGASSVQPVPAAAMGALLLTASDALARAEFLPASLPVGVITLILGGGYLVWLLISLSRSRKAHA